MVSMMSIESIQDMTKQMICLVEIAENSGGFPTNQSHVLAVISHDYLCLAGSSQMFRKKNGVKQTKPTSSLQVITSLDKPSHPITPGLPFAHIRVRLRIPPLQDTEHIPNGVHSRQNGHLSTLHSTDSVDNPAQPTSPI